MINVLLQKAKNVNFNRDLDEKYADGIWDLSMDLEPNDEILQEYLYNKLWEILEKYETL